MKNKKTGIITWYYYDNFGSILQSYAINNVLPNSEFIDYGPYSVRKDFLFRFKKVVKVVLSYTLGKFLPKYRYSFETFKYLNLRLSKLEYTENSIYLVDSIYKNIVCGSDQIWAPNVFDPFFMADFADCNKTNIVSYAASIGLNDIPSNLLNDYQRLLSRFSYISVREEKGAQLLIDKCGLKNVSVVLDPTFLINPQKYKKKERRINIKGKFLFCYFLNSNHKYEEAVKKYAFEHNLTIVGWSAKDSDVDWLGNYRWIGPSEFIWLVDKSEAVVTDSYHGTIFALLFHKNFFTFKRFDAEDKNNQNSRIYQLDAWFDIKNRILCSGDVLIDSSYDYVSFELKLSHAKELSFDYLRKALK